MTREQTFETGKRYFSEHYGCTFLITRRTSRSIFYIVDDCISKEMKKRFKSKEEKRSKLYDYSSGYETFLFPIGFVHRYKVKEVL